MTVNYNIMSHQKQRNTFTKSKGLKSNRAFNDAPIVNNEELLSQMRVMDLEPLKSFDIPTLTNMVDRFQKEIKTPIDIQTSIFVSKSLQRCLEHNNVTTLYCVSDRKPLCVTCMYQTNSHKKHKVVPLNRANRDLQDQKNKNVMTIESNINTLDKLITQSHNNLNRAQKQFPDIINQITDFYKGLHDLLIEKMNDQTKHIQLVWQKMRYQYSSFSQELSDMKIYVIEQIRDIKKREGQEFILYNRNITHNLIKLDDILQANLCLYHQNNYLQQLKHFRQIQFQIGNQLVLTSPFKQKVKRQVKQSFSYMNQTSKKILKNMMDSNEPANIFDIGKDLRSVRERSLSAKQQQALKNNIDALNKDRKRKSLSPKPFRPAPAVSAHKGPAIIKSPIKN